MNLLKSMFYRFIISSSVFLLMIYYILKLSDWTLNLQCIYKQEKSCCGLFFNILKSPAAHISSCTKPSRRYMFVEPTTCKEFQHKKSFWPLLHYSYSCIKLLCTIEFTSSFNGEKLLSHFRHHHLYVCLLLDKNSNII